MVMFRWLLIAALAIALIVTLAGPNLFRIVFGEPWSYAGNAARLLVWGYAAQLISSPLSVVLFALGRVKAAMIFPLTFGALMLIPLCCQHWEPMRFMALLAGLEVMAYTVNVILVLHHLRKYERARTE
jgi:O-antigen/teichoic acid export membrane protein